MQNLTNAVALDFDWQERKLYWSDTTSTQSRIMRMNEDGSFSSREVSLFSLNSLSYINEMVIQCWEHCRLCALLNINEQVHNAVP